MKSSLFILIVTLWLGSGFSPKLQAQEASQEEIIEFLKVMGAKQQMLNSMDLMISNFKEIYASAGVPENFWDNFRKEVVENLDDVLGELALVYQKHYTQEEIKALTVFYESPLGQKLLEKTPIVQQESFAVGKAWGQKLGEKVAREMEEY